MQNSSEEYSFGKCSAVDIHVFLFGVTGHVGIIGHLLLLWFAIEEWLKRKTADRLLVLNLSITNLLVLLPGIPIHLMFLRTTSVDLLCSHFQSTPMLFKRGLESACDLVNIATFVLISFNRREALTKLPHQRKLNIPLTCGTYCCGVGFIDRGSCTCNSPPMAKHVYLQRLSVHSPFCCDLRLERRRLCQFNLQLHQGS
ncbi:hypothetical protein OS493_014041 [Desmophyllum pertusum]|uniref:Uncharacterized protein n=1 Tax=Desmophyllum pertusum TaxID=174260 RepID=A0A9W9ZE63_9CNID|nr:hypothetical protein OS493_014041 [Desmophyllum pertusum]